MSEKVDAYLAALPDWQAAAARTDDDVVWCAVDPADAAVTVEARRGTDAGSASAAAWRAIPSARHCSPAWA